MKNTLALVGLKQNCQRQDPGREALPQRASYSGHKRQVFFLHITIDPTTVVKNTIFLLFLFRCVTVCLCKYRFPSIYVCMVGVKREPETEPVKRRENLFPFPLLHAEDSHMYTVQYIHA